ncbi:hypothetical protein Tco_0444761 [Tanacetum coccineum]
MAQTATSSIEGYEDAIVVLPINANNFELKQTLINLVQSNQFTGRQDPHNHLRFFNKVTSTFRHPEVPNTSIKLLLFPFSLEGEARIGLLKNTSIDSKWDDHCFEINKTIFSTLGKQLTLRNEITTFYLNRMKLYNDAGKVSKDFFVNVLYGFSDYINLIRSTIFEYNDLDALDSAGGGNFLDRCLVMV